MRYVYINLLAGVKITALQVRWSQDRGGAELEARNFAWKFVWIVWIVRTNYKSTKVQKST